MASLWDCEKCGYNHYEKGVKCVSCRHRQSWADEERKDDDSKPKHSHYHKDVSQYDTIDVYVICDLYVKDNVKDLQEAIDTIQRKIEILQGQGGAADD